MRPRHQRTITVPHQFATQINDALERAGYGPNNLSVELGFGSNRTHFAGSGFLDDAMLSLVEAEVGRIGGAEIHAKSMDDFERDSPVKRRNPETGRFEGR